jgi:MarR-like DNA-binding transcriptional regulator SgrR of sgrS sRNA
MLRILLILSICCALISCSPHVAEPVESPAAVMPQSSPQPRMGGVIRVLVGSGIGPDEVRPLVTDPTYVDRIELVDDGGNPALMLRLGEADVALLLGKQIGLVERDLSEEQRLERFESRDRSYFLLIDPEARWLNDPAFRRWLAGLIDRERMLAYLFDGRGQAAYSFTPGRADSPVWDRQATRPLSEASEPRLVLRFDERDPAAATIASRLKALLEVERVSLSFARWSDGGGSMTLRAQMPADVETLGPLLDNVERIRSQVAGELDLLQRASRQEDPELRSELAWWAESSLMRDGRMIPLLRLEAWLARPQALRNVKSGAIGELLLDEAWWAP